MRVPQFKLTELPTAIGQREGDTSEGLQKLWVEGIVSRRVVDTDGDVVEPMGGADSWQKIMESTQGRGTPMFWNHDNFTRLSVGQNEQARFFDDRVEHSSWFDGNEEFPSTIYQHFKSGRTYGFSQRFFPVEFTKDKALPDQTGLWFKKWQWQSAEPVSFGANPGAIEQYAKMCKGLQAKYVAEHIGRAKITLQNSPPVEYEKQEAEPVSKFQQLDANKALERGDMELLCKCHALGNPEHQESMVYPHHTFDQSGAMVVSTRGLITAMDRLMCDFADGVIEEKAARTAYNHLARHFKDAGIGDQLPAFGLYKPIDLAGRVIDQTLIAYADEQAAQIERAHKIGIGTIKVDSQFDTLSAIASTFELTARAIADWCEMMPPKNSKSEQIKNDLSRIHAALGLLRSHVQIDRASGADTELMSEFLEVTAELKRIRKQHAKQ